VDRGNAGTRHSGWLACGGDCRRTRADAGRRRHLLGPHGPQGSARDGHPGGRCLRRPVPLVVAAVHATGPVQHRHFPDRRGRAVPVRRGTHRLLLRLRRDELPRFLQQRAADRHRRAHRRGHGQHGARLGADLRAAGLRARCHRHGQGNRRSAGVADRTRQGRHVLRAAGFAVHRLGHLGFQGLRHGDRRSGAVPGDAPARQQATRDGGAARHRCGDGRHRAAEHRADRARLGRWRVDRRPVRERLRRRDGAAAVAAPAGALEGPSRRHQQRARR